MQPAERPGHGTVTIRMEAEARCQLYDVGIGSYIADETRPIGWTGGYKLTRTLQHPLVYSADADVV
jgi:hypothetical protein